MEKMRGRTVDMEKLKAFRQLTVREERPLTVEHLHTPTFDLNMFSIAGLLFIQILHAFQLVSLSSNIYLFSHTFSYSWAALSNHFLVCFTN